MKGTIFVLFEDFVGAELGENGVAEVLDAAGLADAEPFVGPGSYPIEQFSALVDATGSRLGLPGDEVRRSFGRYAFPALARSAPGLLDGLDGPRQFLEQLDTIIDTEVRKLDPDAHPAHFTVLAVAGDEMLLEYESPHGLFSLVCGFLEGVGDWYRTSISPRLVSTQGSNGTYLITFGAEPARAETAEAHTAGLEPAAAETAGDRTASHG